MENFGAASRRTDRAGTTSEQCEGQSERRDDAGDANQRANEHLSRMFHALLLLKSTGWLP